MDSLTLESRSFMPALPVGKVVILGELGCRLAGCQGEGLGNALLVGAVVANHTTAALTERRRVVGREGLEPPTSCL